MVDPDRLLVALVVLDRAVEEPEPGELPDAQTVTHDEPFHTSTVFCMYGV